MSIKFDVGKIFQEHFGRTPLKLRLEDIMGETLELTRYTDMKNLKEETGDLLASTIQLANECGWDYEELIYDTLKKIEHRSHQYKSLGRKKKVAILGGAFNPIHNGHIAAAQYVLDTSKTFDEVWLMPCNKHMYGKDLVPAGDRIEMCEMAAKIDGRIKVSTFEMDHDLSGETFHMAVKLLEQDFAKHEYDFSLIIGQDNANTFENWVNYEHLEKMMRFVVIPRKGVKAEGKWYMKSPHIFLNYETDIPNVSSTDIRRWILDGDRALGRNLNPEVMLYILNNGFYK